MRRSDVLPPASVSRFGERWAPVRFWLVPGAGLLYLLVLLVGFLRPLAIWHYPNFFETKKEQLAIALGEGPAGALYFSGCLVALVALYVLALIGVRHLHGRRRWFVFVFPLLFSASLLFVAPFGSKDIYHYIAEGRILASYGENPIVTPPSAHPDDPLLAMTAPWHQVASRYGPVWALLTYLPARLAGDGFVANVVAFKSLMTLFYLVTLPLLFLTAERIRAGSGYAAVVFFAWNPLVVFDILFNAHNDMPMLALGLIAVYLALIGRWRIAFLALTASLLVKFVTAILFPILLVWLLRSNRPDRWRLAIEGVVLSALATALLYFPFWEGVRTFDAIRRGSDWVTNSPTTLVIDTLSLVFNRSTVVLVVQRLLFFGFIAAYGWNLWRMRPERGARGLAGAAFWALLLYLMAIAWWFWPWYVLWIMPFAALLLGRREATFAAIFSCSALLGHVMYDWKEVLGWKFGQPFQLSTAMTIGVFLPPWAYWLLSGLPFFRLRLGALGRTTWPDEALQS